MSEQHLYRAFYSDAKGRTRPVTFSAPTRQMAAERAERWKLSGETLSTLLQVRRLSVQFKLAPQGEERKAA